MGEAITDVVEAVVDEAPAVASASVSATQLDAVELAPEELEAEEPEEPDPELEASLTKGSEDDPPFAAANAQVKLPLSSCCTRSALVSSELMASPDLYA